MQNVEVTIAAFGNEDVELQVVVTVLFVAKEKDVVGNTGNLTANAATLFGNETVLIGARMVVPSGPMVVTMGNGIFGNVVAHSVLLERIEQQHFIVALQRDGEVVEIEFGSSGILRREEVHSSEDTVSLAFTKTVHTPLPFGIDFFRLTNHVEIELGNVVVGIDMDAEVHPFVVDARQVAGAVATSVHGAVTRSRGRGLTVVGLVHVDLHSPNTRIRVTSEMV